MQYSTVTIVTPTFNSMRTFDLFFWAVIRQNYPHECMEIIFVDGGSTDGTLERIKKYSKSTDIKISVYHNPLRTAEAGKAVGVRKARGGVYMSVRFGQCYSG